MIPSKPPKLLVVAAWEPELARFRSQIAASPPADLAVVLETLGVGLVESAIAMTLCIVRHRPTAALLLGTCGTFGASVAVGSVITGASARLVDAAVTERTSALPPSMPALAAFDPALHDALASAGAKSVQIANTVGITTDDALAATLARASDADVEHLEAFAFARACAASGVPCGVVLGVANVVGASGRAEWVANHVSASDQAADVALGALPAIAESLLVRTSTTGP